MDHNPTPLHKFTINPKDDPSDKYDNLKWEFNENTLLKYTYNGSLYKINDRGSDKDNLKSLKLLNYINDEIRRLQLWIYTNFNEIVKSTDVSPDKIELFIITPHLLSEIPFWHKDFDALNKPRGRHIQPKSNHIGKDKNLRSTHRDIFLTLNGKTPESLKSLIIHELSHTGCNHTRWFPDNHGQDFKQFEQFLKQISKKINFLDKIN